MLQPDFNPFPKLHTPRLLLRQIVAADAEAIYQMRSNKDVMKYIGKKPFESIEEAGAFIKTIEDALAAGNGINWAITFKEDPDKLIGTIGHWRIIKEHYRAELGYTLQQDYWRKGIVKEAVLKVIEFGFNEMNLHSIEARLNPGNLASVKVLESTGFVREAWFVEDFYFNGKFEDTAVYSRLRG